MTRSILCSLLALLSVGVVGALPVACQSAGVGDPCTPEDEYDTQFAGFALAEENIESSSFQCQSRVCLVNHFQGRVSCPAGQGPPIQCQGTSDTSCPSGSSCVLSETYAPPCAPCDPDNKACVDTCTSAGFPTECDGSFGYCGCTSNQTIGGVAFHCEAPAKSCPRGDCPHVLDSYVCHDPSTSTTSHCQTSGDTVASGKGKECCVPGTDTPVAVSVCGQCDAPSKRNAAQAVYCSCRCCVPCCPPCADGTGLCQPEADEPGSPTCSTDASICGPACDPSFNYCTCPGGYACTEIRPDVGLGDPQVAGAYCVQAGTAYLGTNLATCGTQGYAGPGCH